jgi:hypothetical protein
VTVLNLESAQLYQVDFGMGWFGRGPRGDADTKVQLS